MAEYWIVSAHRYVEHPTLEAATAELRALQAANPTMRYRVRRCKRSYRPARHFDKLKALLKDIVREGLTKANRERAQILLSTIERRNGA